MNKLWILLFIAGFFPIRLTARAQTGENVDVRSGIDHDEFDRLLKKYVNEQGLVNPRSMSISISSQQRPIMPRREMRKPLHS